MRNNRCPVKANTIKGTNTLFRHAESFTPLEFIVGIALFVGPFSQLTVFGRNYTVSVLIMKISQLLKMQRPPSLQRIPAKADIIQLFDSLGCQGRDLALLHEHVAVALRLDPEIKLPVLGVSDLFRNRASTTTTTSSNCG
jgi:hypothetical protein